MNINIRKKERQSGKTTDIVELAEILLSLDKKLVLLLHNRRALEILKTQYPSFVNNKAYIGKLLIGSASDLTFIRGHRFDTVLVDEWDLVQLKQKTILASYSHNNCVIYATDNIDKPLFNSNTI